MLQRGLGCGPRHCWHCLPPTGQCHQCRGALVALSRGTSGTVRSGAKAAWQVRGTSGTVRRRRLAAGAGEWQHGPASRRLPPYAQVPLGVRPRLPGRPNLRQATCAIQRSQPHRAQAVLHVALVALSGSGAAATVGGGDGRAGVAARPCSQTPAALCLCPSWGAPTLARTAKLAPGPPESFSGPIRIVCRPCCAWH